MRDKFRGTFAAKMNPFGVTECHRFTIEGDGMR